MSRPALAHSPPFSPTLSPTPRDVLCVRTSEWGSAVRGRLVSVGREVREGERGSPRMPGPILVRGQGRRAAFWAHRVGTATQQGGGITHAAGWPSIAQPRTAISQPPTLRPCPCDARTQRLPRPRRPPLLPRSPADRQRQDLHHHGRRDALRRPRHHPAHAVLHFLRGVQAHGPPVPGACAVARPTCCGACAGLTAVQPVQALPPCLWWWWWRCQVLVHLSFALPHSMPAQPWSACCLLALPKPFPSPPPPLLTNLPGARVLPGDLQPDGL